MLLIVQSFNEQKSFILIQIFLVVLLISFCTCPPPPGKNDDDFPTYDDWEAKFPQQVSHAQRNYRQQVYTKNQQAIIAHNNNPTQTYQKGVNQFTAYTIEEFKAIALGTRPPNDQQPSVSAPSSSSSSSGSESGSGSGGVILLGATTPVNWTAAGKVTVVKNQGGCGSCWSFATVAALESAYYIQKNKNLDLSEQQLVDCSSSYGNAGCNGGWPGSAMNYIKAKNINNQAAYPYRAVTQACKNLAKGIYYLTSYKAYSGCSNILAEIRNRPIVVEVDASTWSSYKSGVFTNCLSNPSINHAVTLAGIDSAANWWIKNSWGTTWGQKGYMLLAAGNRCGICLYSYFSPYL